MTAPEGPCPDLCIVIPARDEGAGLEVTLRAVLADPCGLALRIVVVANGEDCAGTARCVAGLADSFAAAGHDIRCIVCAETGKAAALACGDRLRDPAVPVVYLDADCSLVPGTLAGLHAALSRPEACMAGPRISPVVPGDRIARSYLEVWKRLPGVRDDVIGAGCYAVNPAGRARWGDIPLDLPDDAFVRSLFHRSERVRIPQGGAFFVFPAGPALPAAVRRWRAGNRCLAAAGRSVAGPGAAPAAPLPWLARHPRLWRHLPAFVWVSGHAMRLPDEPAGAWHPRRPDRGDCPAVPARPRLTAVVVTYNSAALISDCLASLTCRGADLDICVIDNGSTDDTLQRIAALDTEGRIAVEATGRNLGFAAAVNRATQADPSGTCGDYILLVNPDAVPAPDAIDALLALARLRPGAGLYGGRMETPDGRLDRSSCLALPSLRLWLAFALCAGALPGLSLLDPDSLGGWRRDDTREVPALTGGFLLVSRHLWQRLDGFDTRFFLYGEDVDLCRRARSLGARPMMTDLCRYCHVGGASASSRGERTVLILHGLVELTVNLPMARVARCLILLGVAIRACIAPAVGSKQHWQIAWRHRDAWRHGWRTVVRY